MESSLDQNQVFSSTLEDGSLFMSTYLEFLFIIYFSNNSIEVNLLECTEKENFAFEKIDNAQHSETESSAGRIGASL